MNNNRSSEPATRYDAPSTSGSANHGRRWRRLTEAGRQQASVPARARGPSRATKRRDEVDEAPLVAHVVEHQLQ